MKFNRQSTKIKQPRTRLSTRLEDLIFTQLLIPFHLINADPTNCANNTNDEQQTRNKYYFQLPYIGDYSRQTQRKLTQLVNVFARTLRSD